MRWSGGSRASRETPAVRDARRRRGKVAARKHVPSESVSDIDGISVPSQSMPDRRGREDAPGGSEHCLRANDLAAIHGHGGCLASND
ncbi:hypothetical protein [Lysobacter sp. CA196]|uniref:hypothetical protein n=1 Tax=Lysobacter sp. CA196 TaxID=3455606 RepID=UPI003F8D8355